ncbi:DUF6355 family natural product biosynthesis protein [Nonomuraea cavernae]|uniref:DUF6355 family natural product biosynthesis protein n=1 Tax=Nonomuraea cavernae TaxID=2045107 RepID=UPI001CD923AC|nr:hypothetical protein [Nonomuraea cavernae]MCA2187085.1 hypothetical protein [Nonomuraea cavernae]
MNRSRLGESARTMTRATGRRWALTAATVRAAGLRRALTAGAVLAGAVALGGAPAAATTGAVAAKEAATSAVACGLYRDEDAALYKNCTGGGENIFVTYIWSANTYYCVPAGETKHLGRWSNVFRVYNRGGC